MPDEKFSFSNFNFFIVLVVVQVITRERAPEIGRCDLAKCNAKTNRWITGRIFVGIVPFRRITLVLEIVRYDCVSIVRTAIGAGIDITGFLYRDREIIFEIIRSG